MMADIIEASFYISFQYPFSAVASGQVYVTPFDSVVATSVRTEPVGAVVGCCFGYGLESQKV
jgi:hypothetical protein